MMSQLDELLSINKMLVEDQPQYRRDSGSFPKDVVNQRKLMRSLMNVLYPRMIPQKLLEAQDVYLSKEREAKGVVHVSELVASPKDDRLILWQGDITRLDADAIVNAANVGCAKLIPLYILGVSEESRNSATLRRFSSSGTAA